MIKHHHLKTSFIINGSVSIKNRTLQDLTSEMFKIRSSHRRCSIKKGALRNFAKFAGKQLCQRHFFNKVAGLRTATLLKKSLWHSCFPVNFAKFVRTPFLQSTSGTTASVKLVVVFC